MNYNYFVPYGMPLIVQNFGFFTPEALQNFKNDQGLECDLRELVYIQSYYRARAHRDPSLDELKFLDAVISHRKTPLSRFVIEKLDSDSVAAGESFDDAAKKLSELGHVAPFSLADIASVADEYLDRAGKRTATPGIFGKCADQAELEFYFKGCAPVAMPETDLSRCVIGKPVRPPRKIFPVSANDVFVIIFGRNDADSADVGERLARLLYHPEITDHIRKVSSVGEGAIFDYLTSAAEGFYADAVSLPPVTYEYDPLAGLFAGRENCVVTAVSGHMLPYVSEIASGLELTVAPFGHPLKEKRISVRYGGAFPLEFEPAFISDLPPSCPVSAEILVGEAEKTAHSSGSRYTDELVFASSSCVGSSVREVTDSIVAAVSPLVAAGVRFTDISVSFDCKLPLGSTDRAVQGNALSLLLGKYRAQAELCLRSEGNRYTCSSGDPSICTFARAARPKKKGDSATDHIGSLYLVAARRRSDGLLDFESLRELYGYVASLIEKDQATSVTALGCDALDTQLEGLTIELPSPDNVPNELKKCAVGAFIIESEAEIHGLLLKRKDFSI
ncbi:MAG: hypothetical protein IJX46_01540 [Clostridia bacterium]|nr:hypothetical protein [Clostridia bacterium]